MNILYVFHSLGMGGAERKNIDVAVAMKERGHNVYVASPKGDLEKDLLQSNIDIIGINISTERKTLASFINIYFRILSIVIKNKIDVIHTIHRWPNFVCYYVCMVSGTKLIWSDEVMLEGNKFLTTYRDKVISVSHKCKKHLMEYFRIPENKIVVINNCVRPLPESTPLEIGNFLKENGISNKARIACTIGRLAKQKGHEYLLKAIPKILSEVPDIHFIFAGDGELRNSLVELANNLMISDHISFLGQRSDVSVVYAASEVMVLPSLWEGLPLTILEAFSLAKPVIATNVGGNSELVSDNETGYIVEPEDPEALANSIIKILSDKNKCKEMGLKARNLVLEKYDYDKMISKIEQVYREVIKR
ncbi:MAG: glycosyltransferase family 4 protein [Candidatus Omnitrophota bacterium]